MTHYYTTSETVERLGLNSTQALDGAGLDAQIENHGIGDALGDRISPEAQATLNAAPYTRLWRAEEVEAWADALQRRRGLIALGVWGPKAALLAAPLDDTLVLIGNRVIAAGALDYEDAVDGLPVNCVAPWRDDNGEPIKNFWCPVRGVIEASSPA